MSDRVTFYACKGNKEVAVRVSDDYDYVVVRYMELPVVLHRYVTETSDGYRSNDHIWRIRNGRGELIEIDDDGTSKVLVDGCKPSA